MLQNVINLVLVYFFTFLLFSSIAKKSLSFAFKWRLNFKRNQRLTVVLLSLGVHFTNILQEDICTKVVEVTFLYLHIGFVLFWKFAVKFLIKFW